MREYAQNWFESDVRSGWKGGLAGHRPAKRPLLSWLEAVRPIIRCRYRQERSQIHFQILKTLTPAAMSYSANDNQNFFVSSGRTTSRVVAQPGGQCSISIGGWTPEELELQRKKREAAEQNPTTLKEPKQDESATKSEVEKSAITSPVGKENNETVEALAATRTKDPVAEKTASVSSNSFASASNTNSFNVITDRPTSRVTRPPGGHCSIVLG